MFIDCSKLPDPLNPVDDDVYTSPGAAHTVVVTMAPYRSVDLESGDRYYMRAVRDGTVVAFEADAFPAVLVSLGLRPWGRLDRSAATRPGITRDPELVDQRLAAFGPHLRALREQYGLSMGDLARALGCPPARLSQLELAEPDPVREGPGVREDEGRAALAELLAETVARVYVIHRGEGSGAFEADVWQEIYGMLATEPARAAMSTILKIGAAKPSSGTPAPMPTRALTQALQLDKGGFRIEVYEPAPDNLSDYDLTREYGGLILGSGRWQPTTNEAFSRAAVAQRWPGVSVEWIEHPDACLRTTDETALRIADAPTRGLLVVDVPPVALWPGTPETLADRLRRGSTERELTPGAMGPGTMGELRMLLGEAADALAAIRNAIDTGGWHAGVHRVGDRIRWVGRIAKVVETDPELDHVAVVFEDNGERVGLSAHGAELANENVAVQTARAGLGLHLARSVLLMQSGLSEVELEGSHEQRQIQSTIEAALATDEAQRLIRLHG